MTGVYIHIPFCDHICFYCDFPKVLKAGQPVDDYLTCLIKEIKKTIKIYKDPNIETIYIGGGTPSALSTKQLDYLFSNLNDIFDIKKLKEFCVETNPNDLQDLEKLKVMLDSGINRLSIGAQSFNDEMLKKIGRTHDRASIIQAVQNAHKIGFDNINLDLMFRLPEQTFDNFSSSLQQALKLEVNHFSIYSMILEQHTVFHNLLLEHRLKLPSPNLDRRMYSFTMEYLAKAGFHQYEISNFALGDKESAHNKLYWENKDYFGFGAGAHGHLGSERKRNRLVIKDYINELKNDRFPTLDYHLISKKEVIEEELFLGLRMIKGIDLDKSSKKLNINLEKIYSNTINNLINTGLLKKNSSRIFLSQEGKYVANEVFAAFLLN